MKRIPLPKRADEVTAGWMQKVLVAGGASDFPEIGSVKIEKMSGVTSALGALFRCRMTAHDGAEANPASVIVKFPTTNPLTVRLVSLLSAYRREYVFYRDIASRNHVRVPHLFYGDYDERTHRSILILEDLGDMLAIPQSEGVGVARARLAVREIAALQGFFWDAEDASELAALGPFLSTIQRRIMQTVYLLTLPRSMQRFPDLFTPNSRRHAEAFGTRIDAHFEAVAEGPNTIVHGDYRGDNVLFGSKDLNDLSVIDWQGCGIGCGMYDVAFFLGTSVSVDDRRKLERDAVDEYHDIVSRLRAKSFTRDDCWRSYRQNMLGTLMPMVIGSGGMDMSDPRLASQTRELLNRTLTAIEDLESWDFMPTREGYFSTLSRCVYKAYALIAGRRK